MILNVFRLFVGHLGSLMCHSYFEALIQAYMLYIRHKVCPSRYVHSYVKRVPIKWTDRWASNNEARQTKIFFPEPNGRISKKLLTYNRQTCAKMFRWISGHSFHRYHNHLLQPETYNSPTCRLCAREKEETSHLFAYCTGLEHIRLQTLGSTTLPDHIKWTPHELKLMIEKIDKVFPEEGTQLIQDDTIQLSNSIDQT